MFVMFVRGSLLFLFCLAGPLSAAEVPVVVENPAMPPGGEVEWSTQPLWELGEAEDDPLLGYVSAVLGTEDGRTLLLDAQLSAIHVVGPDGTLERSFGRAGDGPGEFRQAQTMFFLSGGRVAVPQFMPPKVETFDLTGAPKGTLPVEGEGMASMVQHGAGRGAWSAIEQADVRVGAEGFDTRIRLLLLDAEDRVVTTLLESVEHRVPTEMHLGRVAEDFFSRVWDLLPGGRVVASPRYYEYELQIFGPDGTVQRRVRRDYEPVAVDRKALEEMAQKIRHAAGSKISIRVEVEQHPLERAIAGVWAWSDGSFWTRPAVDRRGEPVPADRIGPFDVFDAEGHLQRRVTLRVPFDPDQDSWFLAPGRVYVVHRQKGAAASFFAGMPGMGALAPSPEETADAEEDELPLTVSAHRWIEP